MNGSSLLNLEETLRAVGGTCVLGKGDFCFTSVQTDSRAVQEKSLFVPLIGEKQDGHAYVPQAVERGASVVFIARKNYEADGSFFTALSAEHPEVFFITVENTLAALQAAAACYVQHFPSLIRIGVTGSSGKTSTKEIAAAILSVRYRVITNKGNLNSETGLPLSVFTIRKEHQVGLFEMGMNRRDEMRELAAVLRPRYALVTNIGTAHIGMLGSREGIAAEKAHVFDYLDGEGTAVIPADDDFAAFLASRANGKVVYYGNGKPAGVQLIADRGLDGTEFSVEGQPVLLPLPGAYNYKNALGAIALAQELGLSAGEIAAGIRSLKPLSGRSEVRRGTYTIIQDCYNANPDSMDKAIALAASVPGDFRRIYVLGDMLELGADAAAAHAAAGKAAVHSGADAVVFVGSEMKAGYEAALAEHTKTVLHYIAGHDDAAIAAAAAAVQETARPGDLVLLKASRGMALERLGAVLEGGAR